MFKFLFAALVVMCTCAQAGAYKGVSASVETLGTYRLSTVIEAGTLRVVKAGHATQVHLIGVANAADPSTKTDAKWLSQLEGFPVDEARSRLAEGRSMATQWILDQLQGQELDLEAPRGAGKDRGGRRWVYAYRKSDGLMVNTVLIASALVPYSRELRHPLEEAFLNAEIKGLVKESNLYAGPGVLDWRAPSASGQLTRSEASTTAPSEGRP